MGPWWLTLHLCLYICEKCEMSRLWRTRGRTDGQWESRAVFSLSWIRNWNNMIEYLWHLTNLMKYCLIGYFKGQTINGIIARTTLHVQGNCDFFTPSMETRWKTSCLLVKAVKWRRRTPANSAYVHVQKTRLRLQETSQTRVSPREHQLLTTTSPTIMVTMMIACMKNNTNLFWSECLRRL